MTTITRKVGRAVLRSFLFVTGLFSRTVEYRAKRLLLIGSINATLVRQGVMTKDSVEVVNTEILKVNDTKALDISRAISPNIWEPETVCQIVKQHRRAKRGGMIHLCLTDATAMTDKIIELSPRWLRYDPAEMHKDIMGMLMYNSVLC